MCADFSSPALPLLPPPGVQRFPRLLLPDDGKSVPGVLSPWELSTAAGSAGSVRSLVSSPRAMSTHLREASLCSLEAAEQSPPACTSAAERDEQLAGFGCPLGSEGRLPRANQPQTQPWELSG